MSNPEHTAATTAELLAAATDAVLGNTVVADNLSEPALPRSSRWDMDKKGM